MFDTFKTNWLGRRVDYDRVYNFQCVDLVLEYIYECYGIGSGVWGNAIDYSKELAANAKLREKFDLIKTTDVKAGDIVPLNGLAGNPYGHIGLATGAQTATEFALLEQNGDGSGSGQGGDAVRVRWIPKSRIAAVLRPKAAIVQPPATSVPARSQYVYLPASTPGGTWTLYHQGTGLRKGTTDVKATLKPGIFTGNNPPGITYPIEAWVGDYAVVVTTKDYGRGVLWVKNTDAQIK